MVIFLMEVLFIMDRWLVIKNKSIHFYLNMDEGKLFFNPNYPSLKI